MSKSKRKAPVAKQRELGFQVEKPVKVIKKQTIENMLENGGGKDFANYVTKDLNICKKN